MSTAITKRQREILEILWTNGEATSGDIGRALPDAPTASTVRSLLQIMGERSLIVDDGSSYRKRYRPAVSREEVANDALPDLLQTRYAGSVEALLDELLERNLLDIEILEKAQSKATGSGEMTPTESAHPDPSTEHPPPRPGRRQTPSAGTLIAGGVAFGIGLFLGRR
jgi:predicted transcriptional regulator